ncbi:hypothetical protein BFJ63_vAg11152 [Fusarium oxysporum f. sp. narcissi]|uniref:Uncharacterized protein n=1 Tax=Fusarium oxysporum f. sp. narcissi TaxID=451672 RepID=A0A4Q2VFS8_FUSOX|nr:hypothetical protein BFJ63_vAg11152 [Fusarium oxysporum f. sp. narcissi]
MERQPEITLFNPQVLDWLLESVPDRVAAATIRSKLINACEAVEQKGASATETLQRAEAMLSQADEKSRLLHDERNALREEKEKLLRDAKQLTSLPETVTNLASTLSSAVKDTQDSIAKSLHEMNNATKSHRNSIESSSGETSTAIRDIKAVGERLDKSLNDIKQSLETGLQREDISAVTQSLTENAKTLTDSIAGIPAKVRQGLDEEMTLGTFFKPFELRDKLTQKEQELEKSQETNQRLIDQMTTIHGSKVEVTLLLKQEKERVDRRNMYIETQKLKLEEAEERLLLIPNLEQQLEAAKLDTVRAASLSTELVKLKGLYEASQKTIGSQREEIQRLQGQAGQILALEGQARESQQRARELEVSRSNAQEQIKQLGVTLQNVQTLHQESKESLQGRLDDKVELLRSKDQELDRLHRDVGDMEGLRQRLTEAGGRIHHLGEQLQSANSDATTYLGELNDSIAHAAVLEKQLSKATGMNQALRTELEDAKTRSSNAEKERQDLDRQFTDATAKLVEVQNQLSSQEARPSLQIPEGPLGELASMYAELTREVIDLPVLPQGLATCDLRTLAVAIAPLLFRIGSKTNLSLFLDSGPTDWHCLENVVDGMPRPEAIRLRKCTDHDTKCVLVRVWMYGERALLKFYIQ